MRLPLAFQGKMTEKMKEKIILEIQPPKSRDQHLEGHRVQSLIKPLSEPKFW